MYKSSLLKVLLALIILSLSMSVDALNNRRGSNNTSNNGTSVVAKGVCKKKDKSDDKDKDKKDKKKDKKGKDKGNKSKNEPLASDDIELVVSGDGSTKEQATMSALRSAIEQAFGTFVSSNTQILNDELVMDEVVSISSGNIKRYDYISENVANGRNYVTLKAIVSIGKLVSFAKSKGSSAELAGATFGMNMKMAQMYKDNESAALGHLYMECSEMIPSLFDYEIEVGEPKADGRSSAIVPVTIRVLLNENYDRCHQQCLQVLHSLALSGSQYQNEEQLQTMGSPIIFHNDQTSTAEMLSAVRDAKDGRRPSSIGTTDVIYLRNGFSTSGLLNKFIDNAMNFEVSDGIKTYKFGTVFEDMDGVYISINGKKDDTFRNNHSEELVAYEAGHWNVIGCSGLNYVNGEIAPILSERTSNEVFELKGNLRYSIQEINQITKFTIQQSEIKQSPVASNEKIKEVKSLFMKMASGQINESEFNHLNNLLNNSPWTGEEVKEIQQIMRDLGI